MRYIFTVIFAAMAALSFSLSAYADPLQAGLQNQAQGQLQGQQQKQGQIQGQALFSSNKAKSSSRSSSRAKGVGIGVGAALNKGVQNHTTVDASTKVDADPASSPHIALTSTGCIGSVSGSGTAPVVGIGVGITRDHDDCFKIEMAKVYYGLGRADMGDMMMQSTSFFKDAKKDQQEAEQARRDAFAAKYGTGGEPVRLLPAESIAWDTERIGGVASE